MSLEGGKLICLNADDDGQFETITANGRTFKFGYYMDCDVVLEHPDAIGLQCVINCDAFGRVTIENRCSDQPIMLDGKTLVKMRPLLHNTEICILDKKYLWQFDGNPEHRGFQMEDTNDFITPSKEIKKPQQPPNSEPARRWRKPLQNRLTIHSFAYCIKAGESPKDVETTTDENKPLNIHKRIIDADVVPNKRQSSSPPPPENISDFIDLNTPKIDQRSFNRRDQPLSCCKLSETVITSYSPRETGIRQEKSFAVVQSPLTARKVQIGDQSLGPFHHIVSPQTIQNYRPSMHLIDLITPKKLIAPASSPSRTLLKSTLKKNLPKGTSPQTPQKPKKIIDLSTPGSSSTVYSVRSTDDESVIILSDDCIGSPSPIAKTPPRARTPQSLMKRAILSSAKKVAVEKKKKFLNLTGSKETLTPIASKSQTAVRFQSQSTPQRKSLGRFPSSTESLSAGKPRRSLVTSTPFRERAEIVSSSSSRRSLIINSQSSAKNESRNSLMLKQALSMTPTTTSMTQKRNSISCIKSQNKPRKSVSFLQHVEKEEHANADKVEKAEVDELLNHTFTIEDDNMNDIESDQGASCYRKDVTCSPAKEKCQEEPNVSKYLLKSDVSLSSEQFSTQRLSDKLEHVSGCHSSSKPDSVEIASSQENPTDFAILDSAAKSKDQASLETDTELTHSLSNVSQIGITSENQRQLDTEFHQDLIASKNTDPQPSQTSKNISKINESISGKHLRSIHEDTDYDFDGADDIFKTPKAKNIMILSSPKSISLQKTASDSVELIHSTEFDFSANLDDLFQTPQSEFITGRIDSATPATAAPIEALSPEEAFDMLVGRPILKKSYARKTPPKKQELSPLKILHDPTIPKTDIEEWIDSVNDILEDEDEMSYLTATIDDISRDPLMVHSVAGSSNAKKIEKVLTTPTEELEMTIKEKKENKSIPSVLKDPLETTIPRSLSPNISGIGLLDHTSESIFSETLAVSDDSSLKEIEKTIKLSDDYDETTVTNNQKQLNTSQEDKARREIEEAFKHFEKQRKTLDEKRLASTPEAKKPSTSIFAKRRTMGNQVSSDPTFDLKAIKAVLTEHKKQLSDKELGESISQTIDLENEKNEMGFEFQLGLQNANTETLLGKTLLSEVELALENEKTERFMDLEFEHSKEVSEFFENNIVKNSEPEKTLTTNFSEQQDAPEQDEESFSCQVEQELELDFENFEEEPEFSEPRVVKTPEPKKATLEIHMRTLGSALVPGVELDLEAAKGERELELAFENFEEEPEFSEQRVVKTPQPEKVTVKDHRRTLGSALVQDVKLDLQAAKAERELELAFEHFEEQPKFSEQREVKTPEPIKMTMKDHRRTLGSALVPDVKLDLQAAKAERELELAFENFEEQPEFSEHRVVKTPEPKKVALKDHRRTVGSALVPEVKLDLQAAKAERELELAFENFEEEPEFSEERVVKTPEPKNMTIKDHGRTVGSALVPDVKLDLQAAKAERELELAFEHFEEQPEFSEQREVKTPEPIKMTMKDHRRTLGSALVPEVKLDLQAAKAEREMELAFENFEEEPQFSEQRVVKTPEPKKVPTKDHRRTLGSALLPEVKFDLQAAKAERELELAFENFEEEPEFSEQRVVKTPEPKKMTIKYHRRTLGSALVPQVKIDLQVAKAERELELAFENFEEEPEFSEQRVVKTPEPKKVPIKDHRRTLGSALVPEVKFDLQAAKAERELELAFENFEEEPEFSKQRVVKTPEPKKVPIKDHRRTLGSALVPEVKFDLQAAKAERELELAFENFEEEPEFSEQRVVKTPEPKKMTIKDHRRTLGSALVPEVKFDLQAAKAERELELAFENFEEEPEFWEQRFVKTPEPKKVPIKDHRRTLGSARVPEVKFDLQAAKTERELELAFENFEEEPEFSEQRVVKTPEPKKVALKDHRRTVGSALVPEVKLDLQAAKAERELELAFENFEEEPEFSEQRFVKTPEPKKVPIKDHRRTLGSARVPEVKFDLQAAKTERELELAFENFEEEPEFSEQRVVKTPEPKKVALKDHRRTMGSALVPEVKLDLQAAKAERELELAFENFEEEPEFSEERVVKTPEPKKVTIKDHRRTVGSALVPKVKFDLQAAKAERELELAFENFEEEPEFSEQRVVKTPEPKKVALKDHRRTVGSALVPEVKLDLQAAKAERELELAFENFEEEPEFSEERVVKTPEPKKMTIKDHRRTLGSALVPKVKFDLQAAKAERELELAFENFEEEPEFSEQRVVKTPEPKKVTIKDHRRTLGSALVPEVKFDLQAAKAERELELAFENFEEEPQFSEQRVVKTPEPKKVTIKDHRMTVGSALVPAVKLDLQAAKAERELELAFENFEEEPEFSEQRVVKTPEPKKMAIKDHRRTLGSALVPEVKFDLQVAKTERELVLAFENFEEEPEFSEQRVVKTPEPKKMTIKDHRRTLGSALVPEVKFDLQAAKTERELELAFENFEEEPEFSEQRVFKTPEPKNVTIKDHRRTLGSALVPEVKFDLQAAKAERELELAFENFEEEPEFSEQRVVKTIEPKKSNETETGRCSKMECSDLERNKEQNEENQLTYNENKTETSSGNKIDKVTAAKNPNKTYTYQEDESIQQQTIVKEEMEVKNANNEEQKIQKVDNDRTTETIHPYETVASEDSLKSKPQSEKSTSARSLRRRRNTTDEDDQSIKNPITKGQQETGKTPALRITRKKTVESLDDFKSSATEEASMTPQSKSQENILQMRRTRQNSIDSLTDDTKSTRRPCKELKESNNEEEPTKTSTLRIDSTDVDSTEDEASHTLKNTCKKRIRKIALKTSEMALVETELHHILEPIDEERINSESKITNPDMEAKSLISLPAEANEIISLSPITSRHRIRGRKAQLNVVLIESSEAHTFVTDRESANQVDSVNYIEINEDGNSKEEKIDITRDACESIPSTPQPLTSRGRRPSKTKESSNVLVPGLRKTRKGSVQQDIEVQTVDKNEAALKKNFLPSTSNILTDDSKPGNDVLGTEADDEDTVPPTPMETKTRRRQLPNKASLSLEKLDPENIKTKGVDLKEKIEQNTEATENENSIQSQKNVIYEKVNDKKNNTSSSLPSTRTRGRKPILKHEIVSENVRSVQAQITSEKIVPDKQIIFTVNASDGKESVQFTPVASKLYDQKTVSESAISEGIQTQSATVCEKQDSTTEGLIPNFEFDPAPAQDPKSVPNSPVLSKTRGRRAASKVYLDHESATPKRRVGRPKVAKKTDLRNECTDEGATQENDTPDDERILKVVISDSTKIFTSPEIENGTPAAIQKITPQATSNRRVGRSKTTKKTVPGSACTHETHETPSGEENSNNDEPKSVPTTPVLSKTRGRRAASKVYLDHESATPKRRVGRPKVAKKTDLRNECTYEGATQENDTPDDERILKVVISDSTSPEIENGTPAAIQKITPQVTSNRRVGRSKTIKKTVPGSACTQETHETPSREENSNNDENIAKVVEAQFSEVIESQKIENQNKTPVDVENNIPSKTRGRRAAMKLENEVPALKRARKRGAEQISETQPLEETGENEEAGVELSIQDCELDSENKNGGHAAHTEELMSPVPLKKRGRKAAGKIEPAAVIVKPKTVHTTDCKNETEYPENNLHDDEKIVKVGGALSPDVFKSKEIQNPNEVLADDKNNLPSRTRGRRAAVNSVPASKSGRKRPNEQISETQTLQETESHQEDVIKVNAQGCQLDSRNQEENSKLASVVAQTMTPVPTKKRGRKAAVSTPATATPIRRGGRRQPIEMPILNAEKLDSPADRKNEGDENEEVPMNLLSSETSGHKGALDLITTRSNIETSTPVRRGVRRNIATKAQKSPESAKITIEVHEDQENAKLSPSPSKTVVSKLLLTSKSEELVETSPPIRRGGRTRGARTKVENVATSNVELPKFRGRKANQKVEIVDSSKSDQLIVELVTDQDKTASHTDPIDVKSEPFSPPVEKITQKRSAVQEEITENEDQSKKETEALYSVDIEKNIPSKRPRRAPVKLTEFVVSNLVQQVKTEVVGNKSDGSDTDVQNSSVSKKHEKSTTVKMENVESTQEDSIPAQKRGRRAIVKNDEHKVSAPTRKVGRQGKAKDKVTVTLIQDLQNDSSCELLSDEDKREEIPTRKPTRRARSPTQPVSEEQGTQIEVRTQNNPTHGRGKAQLLKNNSTLESISHTEEEQTTSSNKPKSNRGRKPATKANPEKEITQEKTTNPGLNSNIKIEISQNEDEEKVDQKPKRGRKAATAEPLNNSPVITKPSPVTKKTTRGRKATVKNNTSESEDQSFQSDVQTRSGKKQDKDTKPASKRRNLEILTNDDQDTPSKRTRRKPNKLLCDEFIT